jgi:predicted ABC-type ATPase
MTVNVNDVVLGVDASVVIEQLDTIAPQERLALAKALESCDSVDVLWVETNDEPQLVLIPIEKKITSLGPRAGKYMARGGVGTSAASRSAAGRIAAQARWAGHTKKQPSKGEQLPKGVKRVMTGPMQTRLDYTEAYNPEHPDPAADEKRAAAMADPEFHDGMTPLNPEGKDTMEQFAVMEEGPDGRMVPKRNEFGEIVYSPERKALHDKIIADAFMQKDADGKMILGPDGKPMPIAKSANPTATFMGGGPASGKSTAVEAGMVSVPDQSTSVHVDPDAIKGSLPEYRAMARAGDPSLAGFSHEESSDLSKRMMREAKQRGVDILLDGTGDSSIEKLSKKVKPLQEAGYKVVGNYMTLPTELAVQLAETRGKKMLPIEGAKIGRVVPASIVRATHAAVSTTLRQAIEADLFDSVVLIDNTVQGKPKRVVSKTKGQKHVMEDLPAWDTFMNKQYATSITSESGGRSRIVQPRNTADNAIRD